MYSQKTKIITHWFI